MKNDGKGNYTLSPREAQVLAMICDGRPYKHIAYDLGISTNTVHRHAASFFRACGCHDRESLCELLRLDRERKAA